MGAAPATGATARVSRFAPGASSFSPPAPSATPAPGALPPSADAAPALAAPAVGAASTRDGSAAPTPLAERSVPGAPDPTTQPTARPECDRIRNSAPDAGMLPSPIGVPDIHDPGGIALARFYAALAASAGGRAITRIMYFGDSHVASDVMTGRVRQTLQDRFGDAGVGFVMPAKPARWYAHALLEFLPQSGWEVLSVRRSGPPGQFSGPSGFALQSSGEAQASVRLREVAAEAHFELLFLRQPGGGSIEASFDGHPPTRWSTRGDVGVAYGELGVSPAPRLITIDTPGDGVVTLFGLTLEHGKSGVVLDTLGIPGSRARDHLLWNDRLYREHLIKRDPALVVLAYGTNEGMDGAEPIERYERQVREVVRRVRNTVPASSCLLIGPTDHPEQSKRAGFSARRRTGQIVKAQRRIAAQNGCAFIDLVEVTGGPMSMMRLVEEHLGARDHTHFTRRGYEALGDAISAALVSHYDVWQRATCRDVPIQAVEPRLSRP